jgi:hypothetical protein
MEKLKTIKVSEKHKEEDAIFRIISFFDAEGKQL